MATPDMLTSPQAQQPASLDNPVPGADAKERLRAMLGKATTSQINLNQPQANEPAPAEAGMDPRAQLAALLGQGTAQPVTAPDIGEGNIVREDGVIVPEDMSPMAPPVGIASATEQLKEASIRFKNAWTVTPKESVDVLKGSGLFDDVREKGGSVQVKRKGRKGWEPFDRDKAELIGDTLDLARMAFEGVVENVGRVAGGVTGGTAGLAKGAVEGGAVGAAGGSLAGPVGTALGGATGAVTGGGLGAMAGTVTGASLGGAAGATAATTLGDWVAQDLLKIQQDPARDIGNERLAAAFYGGAFNFMGAKIAKKRAARKLMQEESRNYVEKAQLMANEAMDDINEIKRSGITLGKDGNFKLDPQQLTQGEVPEITVTAKAVSDSPAFRNFRERQGEALKGAFNAMIEKWGAKAGKERELGKEFVLGMDDIKKAEGSILGTVRQEGKTLAGNRPFEMPNTSGVIGEMFQRYGGTSQVKKTGKMMDQYGRPISAGETSYSFGKPNIDVILRENPSLTETQAKSLASELQSLQSKLANRNGTMTIGEMEQVYEDLTRKINASFKSPTGRAYGMELVQIKDALRDEWTDKLGEVIQSQGGDMNNYMRARTAYSTFKSSEKQLASLLKNENLSRDALISKVFEGKNSLNFARSVESVMQESDPQFWKEITTEYFERLVQENTDQAGKINWGAISKKWGSADAKSGIGQEMRELLVKGSGMNEKAFNSLLNLGNIYQKTNFDALPYKQKENIAKKAIMAVLPSVGNTARASSGADLATNLFRGIGKDEMVVRWLQDGALDDVLAQMPNITKQQKNNIRNFINRYTPTILQPAIQATGKIGNVVMPPVKSGLKSTGAAQGRHYLQESVSGETDSNQ